MAKVLLIDLSAAYLKPPLEYREVLHNKLRAQDLIREKWNPLLKLRGVLTYSRGLLSIAACLEQAGHQVTYEHWGFIEYDQTNPKLQQEFEIVGISCVTPTFPMAIVLCKKIKEFNSKILTVIGGSHATFLAEEIIRNYAPLVDVVVRGEGEVTMTEIANNPLQLSNIKGITFSVKEQSGKIVGYQSNPEHTPCILDKLPQPAYHLLPFSLQNYAHNVMISRGCSFKCNYCVDGWYFPKIRCSSVEEIIGELYNLTKHVPEGTLIYFSDSIFDLNKQSFRKLLQAIIKAELNINFSCDLRVQTVTKENIEFMKTAGFIQYCLGIENSDDSLLFNHKQKQQFHESLHACEIIRETYPEAFIQAYWMIGLPGTTIQSLEHDTAMIQKFIRDQFVNIIGNKVFIPYPGTPIFNKSDQFGILIRHKIWSKYIRQHEPVYDLQGISAGDIFKWFLIQEQILIDSYCYILGIQEKDLKAIIPNSYLYRQYINPKL